MTNDGDEQQSTNGAKNANSDGEEANDKEELKDPRKEIKRLKSKIKEIERELQAEKQAKTRLLGVRFGEDDFCNPMQIADELNELKVTAHKFAVVKGSRIEIIEPAARQLIRKHQVRNYDYPEKDFKAWLTAALQRSTLDFVKDAISKIPEELAERQLHSKTRELCTTLTSFAKLRAPKDEELDVLPAKIRQQIFSYAAKHCLREDDAYVKEVADKLLQHAAQFRKFTDNERENSMRAMAEKIVRSYVSLFEFSLKARPGNLKPDWLTPSMRFDEMRMESIGAICHSPGVAICAFPVIEDGRYGVYCKAHVITFDRSYYYRY